MPKITIAFGVVLILLGVVGYIATSGVSYTALIPALFGIVFVVLGFVARKENLRKHAIHAGAALALIGMIATAKGVLGLFTMMTGGEVANSAATISRAIMSILSLVFIVLCVRSFVQARLSRG